MATRLKEIFPEEGEVRVARQTKKAEIRISGLDESIKPEEVIDAVAAVGGCESKSIKLGEIKKRSPRSMRAVWLQCPATTAKIIADKGKIIIGWITAKVEVLKTRPMACYKCMERGHTANNCTSEIDRSRRCYNCGEEGHRARECRASAKCPICSDAGKPANHRFGGRSCDPPVTRKTTSKGNEKVDTEADPPTIDGAEANETGKSVASSHNTEGSGREEAMEVGE